MSTLEALGGAHVRDIVVGFRNLVRAHEEAINRLNVYPVPDGDTGTNLARTLDAVVAELATSGHDMAAVGRAIAHGSLVGAHGSSGVILAQMLRGLAGEFQGAIDVTAGVAARGLRAAASGAYQAVLRPVEGTMLTVARDVAEAAESAVAAGADLCGVLRAAKRAGATSLARTPELLPVLRDAGVVDAGAQGYVLLLDAALHVVAGDRVPEAPKVDATPLATVDRNSENGSGSVGEPRYEVMVFLDLVDEGIDQFKAAWGTLGESVVVVGGGGRWSCHVHTDDVDTAVGMALDHGGHPREIRVTDLRT